MFSTLLSCSIYLVDFSCRKKGLSMKNIHFYSVYAKTDVNAPFKFKLDEIEIKKVWDNGMIELKHPYFYCKGDSTYFFKKERNMDEEIDLEHGTVYYSTDKNKCKEFLLNKMREQNELVNKLQERMKESKLEINLLGGKENDITRSNSTLFGKSNFRLF